MNTNTFYGPSVVTMGLYFASGLFMTTWIDQWEARMENKIVWPVRPVCKVKIFGCYHTENYNTKGVTLKRSHPTTPQSIASSFRFSNKRDLITWPLNPRALLFLSLVKMSSYSMLKPIFNYAKLPISLLHEREPSMWTPPVGSSFDLIWLQLQYMSRVVSNTVSPYVTYHNKIILPDPLRITHLRILEGIW